MFVQSGEVKGPAEGSAALPVFLQSHSDTSRVLSADIKDTGMKLSSNLSIDFTQTEPLEGFDDSLVTQ